MESGVGSVPPTVIGDSPEPTGGAAARRGGGADRYGCRRVKESFHSPEATEEWIVAAGRP